MLNKKILGEISILEKAIIGTLKVPFISLKNVFPRSEEKILGYKSHLSGLKEHYQEKIEQKSGVKLRGIEIMLSSEWPLNFMYELMEKRFDEIEEDSKLSPSEKLRQMNMGWNFFIPKYFLTKFIFDFTQIFSGAFSDNGKRIVFNDSYISRCAKDLFGETDNSMMIHELCHKLWDKINPLDERKIKNYGVWSEGFAMYGEKHYF